MAACKQQMKYVYSLHYVSHQNTSDITVTMRFQNMKAQLWHSNHMTSLCIIQDISIFIC